MKVNVLKQQWLDESGLQLDKPNNKAIQSLKKKITNLLSYSKTNKAKAIYECLCTDSSNHSMSNSHVKQVAKEFKITNEQAE